MSGGAFSVDGGVTYLEAEEVSWDSLGWGTGSLPDGLFDGYAGSATFELADGSGSETFMREMIEKMERTNEMINLLKKLASVPRRMSWRDLSPLAQVEKGGAS